MSSRLHSAAMMLVLLAAAPAASAAPARPIALRVDARETARHVLHVRESVPAAPGALALAYPKWIPGEHGPTGPIAEVAGLKLEAAGKPLAWRRDDVDMYVVRAQVPKGADRVELSFDLLLDTSTDGYSFAASSTDQLLLLSWNQVVLYPAGSASDAVAVDASLELPDGWKYDTALPIASKQGGRVEFATAPLTTLVDSPVLAGRHFRIIELTPGDPAPSFLDMAADDEPALAIPDSVVSRYAKLAREAQSLFGGRHYRDYHFLVTLSDHVAHFGLEHHESSDDRVPERTWLEHDLGREHSGLLSHEVSHSWNGKFRRPTGLATPDYGTPMKGELLWVYEGLTNYAGWVLAGRSGLRTFEESLENLAEQAGQMEYNRGREWRPLVDTAVEAQVLYLARNGGEAWRRGTDFYDEMTLVWLEADATIRRLTKGAKSLDDFCHAFHGGTGGPELKPYTREDVIRGLNAVAAFDWDGFLRTRVDQLRPHLALDGAALGGWTLAWSDTMSSMLEAHESAAEVLDERWSIGVTVRSKDLVVEDVVPGSAAANAGVAPSVHLVAVNGRAANAKVLRDALRATRDGGRLELLVQDGEYFQALKLDYRDGLRYPVLRRDASQPDLLTGILTPHVKP